MRQVGEITKAGSVTPKLLQDSRQHDCQEPFAIL